jgi:hypothetical protein
MWHLSRPWLAPKYDNVVQGVSHAAIEPTDLGHPR